MNIDILTVGPFFSSSMEILDKEFSTHKLWLAQDQEKFLREIASSIRGIATTSFVGANKALIHTLPKLEIIACCGVGVDAVDVAAAKARGIIVTNTPDVLTECVADLALGLLLATVRRIAEGDRFVRAGTWKNRNLPLARSVHGKTCGILGLGRIGRAIAKRAEGFGMQINYHGRHQQPDVSYRYYANLEEMARDSDFFIVACPGGAQTKHLVNAAILKAIGSDGVLVNIARGSVVDEPALVQALQDKKLGAAGLDVFADEPNVPAALMQMDNVVLLPHIGSATSETRQAMGDLTVANLRAHFSGKPVITPV